MSDWHLVLLGVMGMDTLSLLSFTNQHHICTLMAGTASVRNHQLIYLYPSTNH